MPTNKEKIIIRSVIAIANDIMTLKISSKIGFDCQALGR